MDSTIKEIIDIPQIEFAISERQDKIKNLQIGIEAVNQSIIATQREINDLRVSYIREFRALQGAWEIDLATPFESSFLHGWFHDTGVNTNWSKSGHSLYMFLGDDGLRIPYGSYDHSSVEIRFEDHGIIELHFHYLSAKEVFEFIEEYYISVNTDKIEESINSRMSDIESFMTIRTQLQEG